MIALDAATRQALENPRIVPRDLMEIRARRRSDNLEIRNYMWSGNLRVTISVIDPFTNSQKSAEWHGLGDMVSASAVPRVSDLTVSRVTIQFSGISERVDTFFRTHSIKFSPIILYRTLLDPDTNQFVAPGLARFAGVVDSVQETVPPVNISDAGAASGGGVELVCKNQYQDLTRSNPAVRSDAYQRRRLANDTFRASVSTIADRDFFWGRRDRN